MSTLVVCVDRTGELKSGDTPVPVTGSEQLEELLLRVGREDPEGSGINSLFKTIRLTEDLEADGEEAIPALVSGGSDGMVRADRAVSEQLDTLVETYDFDSAIVVIDSAQDEQLVPIVESRLAVDAVDRVVVRQARDLESTYYLLKQFLADEELRQTILVPLGVTLIVFPLIQLVAGTAMAIATISAVIGVFLLYKGLGIDHYFEGLPGEIQQSLYSGRISIVTYVIGAGLLFVGLFVGVLGATKVTGSEEVYLPLMRFIYDSIPWLAMAALAASTGRALDDTIQQGSVRGATVNLPFGVVALGLVIRGFSGYFLERTGRLAAWVLPNIRIGAWSIPAIQISAGARLAIFVFAGIVVSLIGVQTASSISGHSIEEADLAED